MMRLRGMCPVFQVSSRREVASHKFTSHQADSLDRWPSGISLLSSFTTSTSACTIACFLLRQVSLQINLSGWKTLWFNDFEYFWSLNLNTYWLIVIDLLLVGFIFIWKHRSSNFDSFQDCCSEYIVETILVMCKQGPLSSAEDNFWRPALGGRSLNPLLQSTVRLLKRGPPCPRVTVTLSVCAPSVARVTQSSANFTNPELYVTVNVVSLFITFLVRVIFIGEQLTVIIEWFHRETNWTLTLKKVAILKCVEVQFSTSF